jgi:colicin import membrane protein
MSGLKLQYLSNPSSGPSFIFGNPVRVNRKKTKKKKALAKSSKARENKKTRSTTVSKRRKVGKSKKAKRHSKARGHKKTKRNPIVFTKVVTRKQRVGSINTPKERKHAIDQAQAVRRLMKSASPAAKSLYKEKLRKLQKAIRGSSRVRSATIRMLRAEKKKGGKKNYSIESSHMSRSELAAEGAAHLLKRAEATKKRLATLAAARPSRIAADKARKEAHKLAKELKKKAKKTARKSPKAAKALKAEAKAVVKKAKAVSKAAPKKAKKSKSKAKKKTGKKTHKKASKKTSKKTSKKAKKSKAKNKKNPSRKHRKHRKHAKKASRHGHHKKSKRAKYRGNPMGMNVKEIGKQVVDVFTGGQGLEKAGYLVAASVGNELASSAFLASSLGSSVGQALSKINPRLPGLLLPVLPGLALAFGASKVKNSKAKEFGKAVAIITLVDMAESLAALVTGPVAAALHIPLQGVDFTMGKHRSMRGVDFTRAMHGVDYTSMRGVPRGLQALPSLRGLTSHDRADFGAGQSYDDAFSSAGGTLKTNADFGRQMADFGYGATPSMRGAHTGDRQYPDAMPDETGDDSDNPEEGSDHTV